MQAAEIKHYVAMGDSLTAGHWNWGQGDRRAGFAFRLAEQLRLVSPAVQFENLGVNGARVADLLRNQLESAIRSRPDLVTVLIGANDVPGTLPPDFQRGYTELLDRLRAGVDGMIVAANLPDFAHLLPTQYASFRAALRQRVGEFNAIIAEAAGRHGIPVADLHSSPASSDPGVVSDDGFHPNARGHQLIAACFVETLNQRAGLGLAMPGEWTASQR